MNRIVAYTLLALLTVSCSCTAEEHERREAYERKEQKSFRVNPDAMVYIDNKFGDVFCSIREQNEVSVEVTVTVEAGNEKTANEVFDKISVFLEGDPQKVSGITEIDNPDLNDLSFSVDYEILMPKTLMVDISVTFGSLALPELEGPAKISLSHGEMNAGDLRNDHNDIFLSSAVAEFGSLRNAVMDVEYSDVVIGRISELEMGSQYSDIEISTIETFNLESQYDDIRIGSIGDLDIVSKFSDLKIADLYSGLTSQMTYGAISAGHVAREFTGLVIQGSYVDVELKIDRSAVYRLMIRESFSDVKLSSAASGVNIQEKTRHSSWYVGMVGSGDNAPWVNITVNNSNIIIK